jgi:hypothetical protein
MKSYGRREVQIHTCFTSILRLFSGAVLTLCWIYNLENRPLCPFHCFLFSICTFRVWRLSVPSTAWRAPCSCNRDNNNNNTNKNKNKNNRRHSVAITVLIWIRNVPGLTLRMDIANSDWALSWFTSVPLWKSRDSTSIMPQPLPFKSLLSDLSMVTLPSTVTVWYWQRYQIDHLKVANKSSYKTSTKTTLTVKVELINCSYATCDKLWFNSVYVLVVAVDLNIPAEGEAFRGSW